MQTSQNGVTFTGECENYPTFDSYTRGDVKIGLHKKSTVSFRHGNEDLVYISDPLGDVIIYEAYQ